MNTHAHKQKKALSLWQLVGEEVIFYKSNPEYRNNRINAHFFAYLPVLNRKLQLSNEQSRFIIGSP